MDDAEPVPSAFYTGLVARLYGPLRSGVPDPDVYARFVARSGEPALELGCGDGDPLLDLRARGLDVEGLDASADMLARCRRAAVERGLDVVLHEATFEEMDLGRRYRSIFLAGATFNLLPDDDAARRALRRIAAHLVPGGSALVPLLIPGPDDPPPGSVREHTATDGSVMRLLVQAVDRDPVRRVQATRLRYELTTPGSVEALERTWILHWIDQPTFRHMAADAGLEVAAVRSGDGSPAAEDDRTFVFVLRRPAPEST